MTTGFETYDEQGNKIVALDKRVAILIGKHKTDAVKGVFFDMRIKEGQTWAFFIGPKGNSFSAQPSIGIHDSYIAWEFDIRGILDEDLKKAVTWGEIAYGRY
ncbi:hypothetical protein [uncultured Megasphaera sp.]|uniref:hypothetical protein n=1 Tax=uncultured Megasphaera sp. TaxID=165188 RepID=UPI0025999721|nr:hypothetical protein [uncultured Megasphaera sp.]